MPEWCNIIDMSIYTLHQKLITQLNVRTSSSVSNLLSSMRVCSGLKSIRMVKPTGGASISNKSRKLLDEGNKEYLLVQSKQKDFIQGVVQVNSITSHLAHQFCNVGSNFSMLYFLSNQEFSYHPCYLCKSILSPCCNKILEPRHILSQYVHNFCLFVLEYPLVFSL